jgi:hypothetical protein
MCMLCASFFVTSYHITLQIPNSRYSHSGSSWTFPPNQNQNQNQNRTAATATGTAGRTNYKQKIRGNKLGGTSGGGGGGGAKYDQIIVSRGVAQAQQAATERLQARTVRGFLDIVMVMVLGLHLHLKLSFVPFLCSALLLHISISAFH